MIELKSLTLQLGTKLVFDHFDFKVSKGEKVGMIGGESAGKTTLLDIISGRVASDSGKVTVNGCIVTVKRDIYTNFSELHMAEMSAAEKFKMMMLKALDEVKSDEKILLLDEPTKNLNSNEVDWLIDFLNNAETLTVVVASNDRYFRTVTLGDTSIKEINLPTVTLPEIDEDVLNVENLIKIVDGEAVFQNVSFSIASGQKVALVGQNELGKSKMLKVFGAGIPVIGEFKFAPSVKKAYMPRVYSSTAAKSELEKIALSDANFLILDNPTACLSLPMIISLENALMNFPGTVIFADSDREFIQAISDRIIDLTPDGTVDRICPYNEFLANENVRQQIAEKYKI